MQCYSGRTYPSFKLGLLSSPNPHFRRQEGPSSSSAHLGWTAGRSFGGIDRRIRACKHRSQRSLQPVYSRLRQSLWIIVALVVGYWAGSGPFAEWAVDFAHMLGIEWLRLRLSRGTSGVFPLLAAGFLIGQGVYLIARRFVDRIKPMRAHRAEQLASWDPSLKLPRRFGLYRYLAHCAQWSTEDPTTRTQSLALFKLRGLGILNEEKGSLVATELLQRIAVELRLAALPETTPRVVHWLVQYLPRPLVPSGRGMPFPRYPARWSGSTFALAFRELDAVQVVSLVRDLTAWIRSELSGIRNGKDLSLSAGVAIGTSNVTPRSLSAAASEALRLAGDTQLTVVHDPSDLRGESISQMTDVVSKEIPLSRFERPESGAIGGSSEEASPLRLWLRAWGAPSACFAATFVLLQSTGGSGAPPATYVTWPDDMNEVQIVGRSGVQTIRLLRTPLPTTSSGGWTVSDAKMTQGNIADGPLAPCQIELKVTNNAEHTYYVSAYDFTAYDATGREVPIDPSRMLRIEGGLAGRWLTPGESWSAWLYFPRSNAQITRLAFHPDRYSRVTLTAMN